MELTITTKDRSELEALADVLRERNISVHLQAPSTSAKPKSEATSSMDRDWERMSADERLVYLNDRYGSVKSNRSTPYRFRREDAYDG